MLNKKHFIYYFIIIFLVLIGIILFLSNTIFRDTINREKNSSKTPIVATQKIETNTYQSNSQITVLVKITDNLYGVNEVHLPDGTIIYCNHKEEVAFDYPIDDINKEYVFSYINGNNDEKIFKKLYYGIFKYTGDSQVFTVPAAGDYRIECGGASGYYNSGKGVYTSGILNLQKNEQLHVYTGEGNKVHGIAFNGGGSGYYGSGGGATDIRLQDGTWDDFDSLKSRIMIAAGGGGHGGQGASYEGGNGRHS